jgi:hypothetical protein
MWPPIRAVILDNDETTGSYIIVFAITSLLQQLPSITMDYVGPLLQRLAKWMIIHHVFRPGLRQFLTHIVKQREANHIDAVIMYTNQTEVQVPGWLHQMPGYPDLIWSVPNVLAYMMKFLVGQPVFDHILARPPGAKLMPNGAIKKTFARVLDLFPGRPRDISKCVFVDDIAYTHTISAEGCENASQNCWMPIDPYRRKLQAVEVDALVQYVFNEDSDTCEVYTNYILDYCILHDPLYEKGSSTPNATALLQCQQTIEKKFGYLPKRLSKHSTLTTMTLSKQLYGIPEGREDQEDPDGDPL